MADQDLELRGGLDFLALLVLFPSVIFSFSPKISGVGGGGGGAGPFPRSANGVV